MTKATKSLPSIRLPDGTSTSTHEIVFDVSEDVPIAGLVRTWDVSPDCGVVRWHREKDGFVEMWECHYRGVGKDSPLYDSMPRFMGAHTLP